jgi:hypothetical protein
VAELVSGGWPQVISSLKALRAVLPQREPAGSVRRADRAAAVFCLVMCAALIAMTWRPGPASAAWAQAAGFGSAAIAFAAGDGRGPVATACIMR